MLILAGMKMEQKMKLEDAVPTTVTVAFIKWSLLTLIAATIGGTLGGIAVVVMLVCK
jgi:hypothetical protein